MVGSFFRSGDALPAARGARQRGRARARRRRRARARLGRRRGRPPPPGPALAPPSVQHSEVLQQLNEIVPPDAAAERARARRPVPDDRRPGDPAPSRRPARSLDDPVVRAASPSVVRVLGTACGLGISGSRLGRRARTRRHRRARRRRRAQTSVVQSAVAAAPPRAGGRLRPEERRRRPARAGAPRAAAASSPTREPNASVAIVGYPQNGPLDAEPGRIGPTEYGAHRRRVRPWAGAADDHEPRRQDPPRQLRRPGDRRRRPRPVDGLRRAHRPRRRRLRRSRRRSSGGARARDGSRSRPAPARPSRQELEHARAAAGTARPRRRPRSVARCGDELPRVREADLRSAGPGLGSASCSACGTMIPGTSLCSRSASR